MCGICGIYKKAERISERIVEEMCLEMAHRGPDASGTISFQETFPACVLGHVRLSIIDLAGGVQPMSNEDGTIWIAYNGEVYNHRQLRKDLEARGHIYSTNSDTETLIHLYEEYGLESPRHLRGMFAYAIWDENRKRLFLVRDRLGIKPLYYQETSDGLVFGSEIKTLLKSGQVRAELDEKTLSEYFSFGYLTNERTLFKGVKKLLPGHFMVVESDGSVRTEQYWNVHYGETADISEAEAVEKLRELFHSAVEMRMMSDVPLGMFLSGGLDSSAIAGVMSKLSSTPVKAFTIGFEDGYYSEADHARLVAERNGMEMHEVRLTSDDFISSIEKLIWHNDMPIHFPASVGLYFVSKKAREQVKVVLTGEGSDELFGGYAKYMSCNYNMKLGKYLDWLIPEKFRERMRRNLWQTPLPLKLKKGLAHSFLYHSLDPRHIIFDNYYKLSLAGGAAAILNPELEACFRQGEAYEGYIGHFDRFPAADTISRMLYTDKKTYLEELLMKQDKMSMAASIESRVPFLDHELVEFAATLPSGMKVRLGSLKHIIKKAVGDFVPREIVERPKMGFPIPIDRWMREKRFTDYIRSVLLDDRCRYRGVFNRPTIERVLHEHQAGVKDNSYTIWMMLNFELWCRTYLD